MLDSNATGVTTEPTALESTPSSNAGAGSASAPATSNNSSSAPATPAQQDWFLEVNPRTRYSSKDDAIRGYSELQDKYLAFQRSSGPQEKGVHGSTGLKSAEDLVYVLDQYVKLSNAGAPPAAAGGATPQAAPGVG